MARRVDLPAPEGPMRHQRPARAQPSSAACFGSTSARGASCRSPPAVEGDAPAASVALSTRSALDGCRM
eukprot:scaffold3014_cov19-Tisochrysis_lutea.AAC.3